jgi:ubiquinone/menaquinone biosynthesis C-methylase UbiE
MKTWAFLSLIILFTAVSSFTSASETVKENETKVKRQQHEEDVVNQANKISRLTNPSRLMVYQPETLVDMLRIQEGMTILDIGAGSGAFTYLIADRLDRTGKVYATEIDEQKLRFMKRIIKRHGYTNIEPVFVSAKGLDPFYRTISCDVILMCAVYEVIWEPEKYFSALRNALKKDTGRLFIVYYRPDSDFSLFMFDQMNQTLERLLAYGDENPVLRRLSEASKIYINQWNNRKDQNEEIPLDVKRQLVEDFNRTLADPHLLTDMITYSAMKNWANPPLPQLFIRSQDLKLAQWLIRDMDKKGFFSEGSSPQPSDEDIRIVKTINRMMLEGLLAPMNIVSLLSADHPIYFSREKVVKTIEGAGYRLVDVHKDLPHHDMIEFKRIQ